MLVKVISIKSSGNKYEVMRLFALPGRQHVTSATNINN